MGYFPDGRWIVVPDNEFDALKAKGYDWIKSESRWVRENLPKAAKQAPKVVGTGLKLVTKVTGLVGGFVLGEALFPQGGSVGTLPGQPISGPGTLPVIPDTTGPQPPNTIIYSPGDTIYIEGPTRVVYVPVQPARRLKPLVQTPDTASLGTTPVPTITVEQAFNARKWGEILVSPEFGFGYTVKKANFDKFLSKFESNCNKAESQLSDWLLNRELTALDQQAVIFIDILDYKKGDKRIDAVPGMKQIQTLYDAFYISSKNAIRPIISGIPSKVTYEDVRIDSFDYTPMRHNYRNTRGGEANRVSGEGNFPIVLPNSMVDDDGKTAVLRTNAEAFSYLIQYVDSVIGKFPIEIEIEDSDLLQSGNQKAKISLPNIAETLAELSGLALSGQAHSQAQTNLALKTIIQTCKNSVGVSVNQDFLRAIADYFGFEHKEIKREMQIPITPNTDEFEQALQISTQYYESIELTDKKDLNTYLAALMQAAAIIKATNFKRIKSTDIKGGVKAYLQSLKDSSEGISDKDWNQFINEVEAGFINHPVKDTQHPYGRNLDERPRIKNVGTVK
jgi:hypothetical protein